MRVALQDKVVPAAQKAQIITLPPPTGGWNARDSLPMMPPTDAVVLNNMIPWPSDCRMRGGSLDWSTGYPNPVNTLMAFNAPTSANKKMFAAAGTNIYDATPGGAVGAAVLSSLLGDKWQWVNFATSAGQFLCMVNGLDSYYTYNGTAWTGTATLPCPGGGPGVSGGNLPMNTILNIAIYQSTLYFVPIGALGFFYLPAQQITGNVAYFNLAALCRKGGYLEEINTWTVDGGQGAQDFMVCITSEGEVVIFQGNAFSIAIGTPGYMNMVGVYFISRPLGHPSRCSFKYGGDLLILTERGLFPISTALQAATVDKRVAITDKIQPAFVAAAQNAVDTFGWQIEIETQAQVIIVNVPTLPSTQFAMQLQTKGWAQWLGWPANCFLYFNGNMYYGGATAVTLCASEVYESDNGNAIAGAVVPAFTQLKVPGQQKHVKMVRPYFASNGNFGFAIGAATDYSIPPPPNAPQAVSTTASLWNVALWDVGMWGGVDIPSKPWTTVATWPCVSFSPYIQIDTNSAQVKLTAYDVLFEVGGIL